MCTCSGNCRGPTAESCSQSTAGTSLPLVRCVSLLLFARLLKGYSATRKMNVYRNWVTCVVKMCSYFFFLISAFWLEGGKKQKWSFIAKQMKTYKYQNAECGCYLPEPRPLHSSQGWDGLRCDVTHFVRTVVP